MRGFSIHLKTYGAWLTESRTVVEVPPSQIDKLIRDLKLAQRDNRRVML